MSTAAEDKFKKFEEDGVTFKAKLIGSELVMEPRGDKMCQNSIQRLKAIIKGQKVHKKRIVMKISYAGVKICDEKTNEILYHHEVPQISFIASDDTDSRTFGYVCDVPNKAHQFICFKTSGPALQVMSEISSLFEAVLAKKKQQDGQGETGQPAGVDKPAAVGGEAALVTSTPTSATSLTATSLASPAANDSPKLDISVDDSSAAVLSKDLFSDGAGSTGAGGDSGIMDLTFNDWLPSPQQQIGPSCAATGAAAIVPPPPPPAPAPQPQLSQPDLSSPFGVASAAIPIAKPHRPQQLNFTSSSFSGTRFGGQMMSNNNSAAPAMISTASPMGGGLTNRLPSAQNKSLVYNHSSVSLNDAALSNRSSAFTTPMSPLSGLQRQESTDKYAVFNDIDALPSIFESISSLDSSSKLSNAGQQLHPGSQSMDHRQHQTVLQAQHCRQLFNAQSGSTVTTQQYQPNAPPAGEVPRRINPFDDDFFA